MLYVEMDAAGNARHINYAPYLDYRPLAEGEPSIDPLLARPECAWIGRDLEQKAQGYAVAHVVPEHLDGGPVQKAQPDRQDRGGREGPPDQGDQLLGPSRRTTQGTRRRPASPMLASIRARPASAPTRCMPGSKSAWRT